MPKKPTPLRTHRPRRSSEAQLLSLRMRQLERINTATTMSVGTSPIAGTVRRLLESRDSNIKILLASPEYEARLKASGIKANLWLVAKMETILGKKLLA